MMQEFDASFHASLEKDDSADMWHAASSSWATMTGHMAGCFPSAAPLLQEVRDEIAGRVLVVARTVTKAFHDALCADGDAVLVSVDTGLVEFCRGVAVDTVLSKFEPAIPHLAPLRDIAQFCSEYFLAVDKVCVAGVGDLDALTLDEVVERVSVFRKVAFADFIIDEAYCEGARPGALPDSHNFHGGLLVRMRARAAACHKVLGFAALVERAGDILAEELEALRIRAGKLSDVQGWNDEEVQQFARAATSVEAAGKRLQDGKLVRQVTCIRSISELLDTKANCDAKWKAAGAQSPAKQLLSPEWADAVVPFLRAIQALRVQFERGGLDGLFAEEGGAGHIAALDSLRLDSGPGVINLLAKADQCTQALTQRWRSGMSKVSGVLLKKCPDWQEASKNEDELLTAELRKQFAMIRTAEMKELYELSHSLSRQVDGASSFAKHGFPIVSADELHQHKKDVKFGYHTCALSYAMYRLDDVMPHMSNLSMKSKAAQELRASLQSKEGFVLFPILDRSIREFEENSPPSPQSSRQPARSTAADTAGQPGTAASSSAGA